MEQYINKKLCDITYKSELTLDILFLINNQQKCQGFNSRI